MRYILKIDKRFQNVQPMRVALINDHKKKSMKRAFNSKRHHFFIYKKRGREKEREDNTI